MCRLCFLTVSDTDDIRLHSYHPLQFLGVSSRAGVTERENILGYVWKLGGRPRLNSYDIVKEGVMVFEQCVKGGCYAALLWSRYNKDALFCLTDCIQLLKLLGFQTDFGQFFNGLLCYLFEPNLLSGC